MAAGVTEGSSGPAGAIPLFTGNGQAGKRGDDGILDSILHRKNFLSQASWWRVMATLVLEVASRLGSARAAGIAPRAFGVEHVAVIREGDLDVQAAALSEREEEEDSVAENVDRRRSEPGARVRALQKQLEEEALSGGWTSSSSSSPLRRALRLAEEFDLRMRQLGAARLRPSTLRCSAGKDATGAAILTDEDHLVEDAPPTHAGACQPPEARDGASPTDATLMFCLGNVLHALVYVSARDRRTHVPPPPTAVTALIHRLRSHDPLKRPGLVELAGSDFLSRAHRLVGLASGEEYVQVVRELCASGTSSKHAPLFWRTSRADIAGVLPVGKLGGRHKDLAARPAAVAGAAMATATAAEAWRSPRRRPSWRRRRRVKDDDGEWIDAAAWIDAADHTDAAAHTAAASRGSDRAAGPGSGRKRPRAPHGRPGAGTGGGAEAAPGPVHGTVYGASSSASPDATAASGAHLASSHATPPFMPAVEARVSSSSVPPPPIRVHSAAPPAVVMPHMPFRHPVHSALTQEDLDLLDGSRGASGADAGGKVARDAHFGEVIHGGGVDMGFIASPRVVSTAGAQPHATQHDLAALSRLSSSDILTSPLPFLHLPPDNPGIMLAAGKAKARGVSAGVADDDDYTTASAVSVPAEGEAEAGALAPTTRFLLPQSSIQSDW